MLLIFVLMHVYTYFGTNAMLMHCKNFAVFKRVWNWTLSVSERPIWTNSECMYDFFVFNFIYYFNVIMFCDFHVFTSPVVKSSIYGGNKV